MKKTSILLTALLVVAIAALVFTGCRKGQDHPTGDQSTTTAGNEHPAKKEQPADSEHPKKSEDAPETKEDAAKGEHPAKPEDKKEAEHPKKSDHPE